VKGRGVGRVQRTPTVEPPGTRTIGHKKPLGRQDPCNLLSGLSPPSLRHLANCVRWKGAQRPGGLGGRDVLYSDSVVSIARFYSLPVVGVVVGVGVVLRGKGWG